MFDEVCIIGMEVSVEVTDAVVGILLRHPKLKK
jgi:hypothetical protein